MRNLRAEYKGTFTLVSKRIVFRSQGCGFGGSVKAGLGKGMPPSAAPRPLLRTGPAPGGAFLHPSSTPVSMSVLQKRVHLCQFPASKQKGNGGHV